MKTAPLPPFEDVLERFGPALLRFCFAQVGAQRGEDCFQETMLAALRAYTSVRDPAAVRAWLFAIAARKAVDFVRAHGNAPEARDDLELAGASVQPAYSDPALWKLVAALPEKQRAAVTLRYVADLSHREIATVMHTSEAAARRNVFEALTRLRTDLTKQRRRPSH